MTDKDRDELDLYEARKALAETQFAETSVNAVVGAAKRGSREVRSIVERNGYVDRFRELLRGA
jgi:hypothetical protein